MDFVFELVKYAHKNNGIFGFVDRFSKMVLTESITSKERDVVSYDIIL